MSDTTVVLTSCNRLDLLEVTLASFFTYNTYPIAKFILIDDSGDQDCHRVIAERYGSKGIECIFNVPKLGHLSSIDYAYARVETPYIFHCEDDWEFYAPHFIEHSKTVLESDPQVLQVHIRQHQDINGHPLKMETLRAVGEMQIVDLEKGYLGIYDGFSWNPGLRRLKDYQELPKTYKEFGNEAAVGHHYAYWGFKVSALVNDKGYVRHIGNGRHIETAGK
jgi:hypothetical protein